MTSPYEKVLELHQDEILEICGKHDERLRDLEQQFPVRFVARGTTLKVLGEQAAVEQAVALVENLLDVGGRRPAGAKTPGTASRPVGGSAQEPAGASPPLNRQQMRYAIDSIRGERKEDLKSIFSDRVAVPFKNRTVAPMTATQKRYIDSMRSHDVVFGIGPAGTGKTYLAMAMAINHLVNNQVRRIVLVRPAVEAGEKLGFLPGDIAAKFDPFVRPLYDALHDMVEPEKAKLLLENGVVEVAPLAFMRGRTLNSSFVILDEGQNTSIEQMKMFLTRLGYDSKAVITGDVTQIDLPSRQTSGLVHVQKVLAGVNGIDFVQFNKTDVVRHALVQSILRAYEEAELSGTQPGHAGQRSPTGEPASVLDGPNAPKPQAPAEPATGPAPSDEAIAGA